MMNSLVRNVKEAEIDGGKEKINVDNGGGFVLFDGDDVILVTNLFMNINFFCGSL